MNLNQDQLRQIGQLQQEVKAKLDKILTTEQRRILEESRPPLPGGPGFGLAPARPQPPLRPAN
jgi:hypothetical protein